MLEVAAGADLQRLPGQRDRPVGLMPRNPGILQRVTLMKYTVAFLKNVALRPQARQFHLLRQHRLVARHWSGESPQARIPWCICHGPAHLFSYSSLILQLLKLTISYGVRFSRARSLLRAAENGVVLSPEMMEYNYRKIHSDC